MRKLLITASAGTLAALGTPIAIAQESPASVAGASTRSYDLGAFEEIAVIGPHRVVVSVGPRYSVRAEGPLQTLDDTEVEIEDGRLKIHPADERWQRRCGNRDRRPCWDDYQPATFHISLPRISGASLVGSGAMRIDRVEGEVFSASVAGSGELEVAALRVDDVRFSVAGSGDLSARGTARQSRVSIAGSGSLHARDVTSDTASVSIAGSGDASLTVADDARVSVVGSGEVDIAGSARCSVSRMGSGAVRCSDGTTTS